MTTLESVRASIDSAARARQGLMVEQHGYAAPLIGDNDPLNTTSTAGGYLAAGSKTAAVGGRLGITPWLSVAAGFGYTDAGDHAVSADDVTTFALALRVVAPVSGHVKLVAVAGGWRSRTGSIGTSRSYANGMGTAVADQQISGNDRYVFGRLGVAFSPGSRDTLILTGEAGHQRWTTTGFAETLSAANPFPATISDAQGSMGVAKVRLGWQHQWGGRLQTDLWAGYAWTFSNRLDMVAAVDGIGILTPRLGTAEWREYGGRVSYRITDRLSTEMFVNGIAGRDGLGDRVLGGIGVSFRF